MDAQTGEVLPGVLIYQPATGNYTSTDVKGFTTWSAGQAP